MLPEVVSPSGHRVDAFDYAAEMVNIGTVAQQQQYKMKISMLSMPRGESRVPVYCAADNSVFIYNSKDKQSHRPGFADNMDISMMLNGMFRHALRENDIQFARKLKNVRTPFKLIHNTFNTNNLKRNGVDISKEEV